MSPNDVFVNTGAGMKMGGTHIHKALWSSASASQRRKRRFRVADASPGDYVPEGIKGQDWCRGIPSCLLDTFHFPLITTSAHPNLGDAIFRIAVFRYRFAGHPPPLSEFHPEKTFA